MDKEYCKGCYYDAYNHGLGGSKVCWSFAGAKLIMRKEVHKDQVPPWNQKAKELPDCYAMQDFIYVAPDRVR